MYTTADRTTNTPTADHPYVCLGSINLHVNSRWGYFPASPDFLLGKILFAHDWDGVHVIICRARYVYNSAVKYLSSFCKAQTKKNSFVLFMHDGKHTISSQDFWM